MSWGNIRNLMASVYIIDPQGNIIPTGMEGDRVRLYQHMISSGYESTLVISPFRISDAGVYTCTGTLAPAKFNTYITNITGSITFHIDTSKFEYCRFKSRPYMNHMQLTFQYNN